MTEGESEGRGEGTHRQRLAQELEPVLAQERDLALGRLARARQPRIQPPAERQVAPEDDGRRRAHQQQAVVRRRVPCRRGAVEPEARDEQIEDPALDEDDAVVEAGRERADHEADVGTDDQRDVVLGSEFRQALGEVRERRRPRRRRRDEDEPDVLEEKRRRDDRRQVVEEVHDLAREQRRCVSREW